MSHLSFLSQDTELSTASMSPAQIAEIVNAAESSALQSASNYLGSLKSDSNLRSGAGLSSIHISPAVGSSFTPQPPSHSTGRGGLDSNSSAFKRAGVLLSSPDLGLPSRIETKYSPVFEEPTSYKAVLSNLKNGLPNVLLPAVEKKSKKPKPLFMRVMENAEREAALEEKRREEIYAKLKENRIKSGGYPTKDELKRHNDKRREVLQQKLAEAAVHRQQPSLAPIVVSSIDSSLNDNQSHQSHKHRGGLKGMRPKPVILSPTSKSSIEALPQQKPHNIPLSISRISDVDLIKDADSHHSDFDHANRKPLTDPFLHASQVEDDPMKSKLYLEMKRRYVDTSQDSKSQKSIESHRAPHKSKFYEDIKKERESQKLLNMGREHKKKEILEKRKEYASRIKDRVYLVEDPPSPRIIKRVSNETVHSNDDANNSSSSQRSIPRSEKNTRLKEPSISDDDSSISSVVSGGSSLGSNKPRKSKRGRKGVSFDIVDELIEKPSLWGDVERDYNLAKIPEPNPFSITSLGRSLTEEESAIFRYQFGNSPLKSKAPVNSDHVRIASRPNDNSLLQEPLPSGRDWVDNVLRYETEEENLAEIYEQGFTIMMIENGMIDE